MSLTETDAEKIKNIERNHDASQYATNILQRLLKKAQRLPSSYAFDKIMVELIKRGVIKLETQQK